MKRPIFVNISRRDVSRQRSGECDKIEGLGEMSDY